MNSTSLLWLYEAFEKVESLYHGSIKYALEFERTAAELAKDASFDQWEVRIAVGLNPNTPIQAFQQLAKDSNEKVRTSLAANEDTPGEILRILGKDKLVGVRLFLTKNPNTPTNTLELLMNDKSIKVRMSLASSCVVPADFLINWGRNADYGTIRGILINPSTPLDIFPELIKRGTVRARELVFNSKIPHKLFKELFPKESLATYNLALAANPETPEDYLKLLYQYQTGLDELVDRALANNPNTPSDVLKMISDHSPINGPIYFFDKKHLKICVAENPNISKDFMWELSRAPDAYTRCGLARNPNLPMDILNTLGEDESIHVKVCVACNPKTPMSLVEHFIVNKKSILLTVVATVIKQRRNKLRPITTG